LRYLGLARPFALATRLLDESERLGQPLRVRIEALMGYCQTLSAHQWLECFRQHFLPRHDCTADKDRDDRDIALQRSREFNTHEILGIVEAPSAVLVNRGQPVPADDSHEGVTIGNPIGQDLDEIDAELDVVHIEEYSLAI
jgi:hypothetical protein